MSTSDTEFVNLNEVFLPATGGLVEGNVEVNGILEVNDQSGNGTTYDVAAELSKLNSAIGGSGGGLLNVAFMFTTGEDYQNNLTCNATFQQIMDAVKNGTIGSVVAYNNTEHRHVSKPVGLRHQREGEGSYTEQECFEVDETNSWGCELWLNADDTTGFYWFD